jgi:hypothetical protein
MLSLISSSQQHVCAPRSQVCTLSTPEIAYPAPLEAVLRTETSLNFLLQTSGTFQCARIIFAVYARTFLGLLRSLVHGEGFGVAVALQVCLTCSAFQMSRAGKVICEQVVFVSCARISE